MHAHLYLQVHLHVSRLLIYCELTSITIMQRLQCTFLYIFLYTEIATTLNDNLSLFHQIKSAPPTFKELCALPLQNIWYPLGLWLQIEEKELQDIAKSTVSKHCQQDLNIPPDYDQKVEQLNTEKLFELFLELPFGTPEYVQFKASLNLESKDLELFDKCFKTECFTSANAHTCRAIVGQINNPKLKKIGENLIEQKQSKRQLVLDALIKVGLRSAA